MIALPILIHLINLMRHKTVKWAAMEFLLKSHKKNKNWVWLKQLFLLLSRIAALLLALLLLAQIGCEDDRISRLLGGQTTHHYVLIDDSFSMNDRGSAGSAFDRARSTLALIGSRAKNRQSQLFSVLRFSMARPNEETIDSRGSFDNGDRDAGGPQIMSQLADLNGELVDNLFDQKIEDLKGQLKVSSLSVGLLNSLQTVGQLIRGRENENAIVYVLTDFRAKDWDTPADIKVALKDIHAAGAGIELINCATDERPNLAITALEAAGSVRVAGTPTMMRVSVKNCSNALAEKIQIKLSSTAYPVPRSDTVASESRAESVEIPTVFIQSIAPGETETRSFPVFFNTTGKHVVSATLPEDSIATDNQRWNVTEFVDQAKVLLVDDAEQLHSYFLSLAISPGGMTGIAPEFRTKDFLRDASVEKLSEYDVIFLLDVDSFDESAVRNLEAFTQGGGGLAFFVGPKSNINSYNQTLFRNGEGLFPLPLSSQFEVPEMFEYRVADISPNKHPIFAPVFGSKNSLLDLVQVKRVLRPGLEWKPNLAGVNVLASVRGESALPLVVEKSFGDGKVIAFMTTAGPVWNNWSRNATFPPIVLLMQDYLAAGKYLSVSRAVGSTIDIEVPSDTYTPSLVVVTPSGEATGSGRLVSQSKMNVSSVSSEFLQARIGKLLPTEQMRETDLPGIYEAWHRLTDSSQLVERYALNVDVSESEMALANPQKVLSELEQSHPTLVQWDEFNPEPKQKPASSLSLLFLVLLITFLVGEQLLAYSLSYHRK